MPYDNKVLILVVHIGLDSFSALQLSKVLKKVADSGASVLFTIHQPASDIFDSFDRVILMNHGRIMYQGTVENVSDYFGARGHPLPPRYNPADWIMVRAPGLLFSFSLNFHLTNCMVTTPFRLLLKPLLSTSWKPPVTSLLILESLRSLFTQLQRLSRILITSDL
jgi:hypothetical protein